MSLPNTRRLARRPTHPGEMLREDFLPDYGLTVAGLAEAWSPDSESTEDAEGGSEKGAKQVHVESHWQRSNTSH